MDKNTLWLIVLAVVSVLIAWALVQILGPLLWVIALIAVAIVVFIFLRQFTSRSGQK